LEIPTHDPSRIAFDPPYIVKSLWEHASKGLDDGCIVRDKALLRRVMVERRDSLGGECFAEAYIEGREFNVSLLGDASGVEVLPVAEMRFDQYEGRARVLGYEAKWEQGSFAYEHTTRTFDVEPQDKELVRRLSRLAVKCWRLFHLRGYARVDFRVNAEGEAYVLEVNANPCISPDSGFVAAAAQAKISYNKLVSRIVADCPLRNQAL